MPAPSERPTERYRFLGAVMGLLSAAVAIAVAHLVAGFVGREASPVIAVGSTAIDLTPEWLKSFAIRTFGSNDKTVLLIGIGLVLAIVAAVLGMASVRNRSIGLIGLTVFGLLGMVAAVTRPTGSVVDALPSLVGAVAGAATLVFLHARLPQEPAEDAQPSPAIGVERRRFLLGGLAAVGTAFAAGAAGQFFARRFAADESRAALEIPKAMDIAAPAPAGAELGVPDLSPFITPNDEFYRVDTALLVPAVRAEDWTLRIHGMVDREITLDFEQLVARELIERDITLTCVSNEVGGPYVGNARWVGVPIKSLLEEAGVDPAADQLVSRSVDGFTVGTPTAVVMDGRDAMLAVEMNGEPLPLEHGFQVRMVVPGLYGYVSATKWVTEMELTTFDAFDPYWIKRGWAEEAPIKTMSRIDTPKSFAKVAANGAVVAGVAWAQHVGIERVEVRVDEGPWREAELAAQDTIDTWRQWRFAWDDATPGNHSLQVRAIDAGGSTQTAERVTPFPDGATGQHQIVVTVT
ncbi:MAG TPA: molybdopterin-dependent oxidoreductase [Actinomycetota bacterium]|nr:molybdopterin-dependent oxidoreductase [Actinomycetota bacterium]